MTAHRRLRPQDLAGRRSGWPPRAMQRGVAWEGAAGELGLAELTRLRLLLAVILCALLGALCGNPKEGVVSMGRNRTRQNFQRSHAACEGTKKNPRHHLMRV